MKKGIVCINEEELLEKYAGAAGSIVNLIDEKIEEFSKYPFEEKRRKVYSQTIKDNLIFENKDYEEEPEKKKEEIIPEIELKIQLKKTYNGIIKILKTYCDVKEEYYSLIAIWIIGTYLYEEFETYPYLFFNAMRGSGKTRILKLIAALSNKGELLGGISESVLFRTAKGRTLCLDEFERIGNTEQQFLRELLNAAYKKGQKIKRMKKKKEEFVVEEFEVYTPITMANIQGMEEVLGDRCIEITLEKSNIPAITKLIENYASHPLIKQLKGDFKRIQCSLCSVVMSKGMEMGWNNYILSKYHTTLTTHTTHTTQTPQTTPNNTHSLINNDAFFDKMDGSNIFGRNLELAFPLLVISNFLGGKVFDASLKTLKKIMEEKRIEDFAESKDVQIYDFVSSLDDLSGFISVTKLTNDFRDFIQVSQKEDDWINNKWVGRALKRLALIKEKRRKSKGVEIIPNVIKAKEKIKMFKEVEDDKIEEVKIK